MDSVLETAKLNVHLVLLDFLEEVDLQRNLNQGRFSSHPLCDFVYRINKFTLLLLIHKWILFVGFLGLRTSGVRWWGYKWVFL